MNEQEILNHLRWLLWEMEPDLSYPWCLEHHMLWVFCACLSDMQNFKRVTREVAKQQVRQLLEEALA